MRSTLHVAVVLRTSALFALSRREFAVRGVESAVLYVSNVPSGELYVNRELCLTFCLRSPDVLAVGGGDAATVSLGYISFLFIKYHALYTALVTFGFEKRRPTPVAGSKGF